MTIASSVPADLPLETALAPELQQLLTIARRVALESPDRSRKMGAVLVHADGSILAAAPNTVPEDIVIEPWMLERPHKYDWTEHAERNAIFQVACDPGKSTVGATMVLPWFPCKDCARAMVASKVARVVAPYPDFADPNWGEGFRVALDKLQRAGVEMTFFADTLGHHARPRDEHDPAPDADRRHLRPVADVVAHWNRHREVVLEMGSPRVPRP